MLSPSIVSKQVTVSILSRISSIALSYPDANAIPAQHQSLLDTSSIYQHELDELPGNCIILSNEVFAYLRELSLSTFSTNDRAIEYSCYLYGKEIEDNTIVFSNIFKKESENLSRVAVTTASESKKIFEFAKNSMYDCVAHVHTHPAFPGTFYSTPSNHDLYTYAWMNYHFVPEDKTVYYLGALITPTVVQLTDGISISFDLCFIFFDKNYNKFYKATNIYYYDIDNNLLPLNTNYYVRNVDGHVEKRNHLLQILEKR